MGAGENPSALSGCVQPFCITGDCGSEGSISIYRDAISRGKQRRGSALGQSQLWMCPNTFWPFSFRGVSANEAVKLPESCPQGNDLSPWLSQQAVNAFQECTPHPALERAEPSLSFDDATLTVASSHSHPIPQPFSASKSSDRATLQGALGQVVELATRDSQLTSTPFRPQTHLKGDGQMIVSGSLTHQLAGLAPAGVKRQSRGDRYSPHRPGFRPI